MADHAEPRQSSPADRSFAEAAMVHGERQWSWGMRGIVASLAMGISIAIGLICIITLALLWHDYLTAPGGKDVRPQYVWVSR